MLANAGWKDHIVVVVVAVHFIPSAVSSWRQSLTLIAGTGLCWYQWHKVQTFLGSQPFKMTVLSTVASREGDARSEGTEGILLFLWSKKHFILGNIYVGNNMLCPAVRTWYLTNCPKPQQREENSASFLGNLFRHLNFVIMNAIIKSIQKMIVAFCKRERLCRFILHFCTKSALLLYNPYMHSPEGL